MLWGKLKLKTIALESADGNSVRVSLGTRSVPAKLKRDGKRILITLARPVEITAGKSLKVSLA